MIIILIENNTWVCRDMKFIFECLTQYLMSERSERIIDFSTRRLISYLQAAMYCLFFKHKL